MSMGDIIQLISALGLGSIGGGIAGGIASFWKAKQDKELRREERRRARIDSWREELNDEKNQNRPTATLKAYEELRQYLTPDAIDRFEVWELNKPVDRFGTRRNPVQRGSSFFPDIQEHHMLLRVVAKLEREWGLV